ncbi:MFS transporter [Streptacidiphilus sp. MAP5-52]|uniref:MFS transporter n=1 Tax=Streptacidiphilus sp. MAP5-52 TaxID=3156267 RepID=UPI003517C3FF
MGYLRLLRQRDVLVLWLSETLSALGDRFFTLALMWTAWARFGAPAMGIVVIVESVPHLLVGAFGRRLLARFVAFRALAAVEAVQVLVVGAMPWLQDSIGLLGVVLVIAAVGTADAITGPSLGALVPEAAPVGQAKEITGLMALTGNATWVLGPGAAACLLAVLPAERLFLLDALTFAVSACAFVWLARRVVVRPAPGRVPDEDASAVGAPRARDVLRRHPRLGAAIGLNIVGEFFAAVATVGIPIWLTTRLHAGASAYGVVITAMGVGAVAGNLLAGHLPTPKRFTRAYCLVWAARGALLVVFAFTQGLGQVVAVTAVAGALSPAAAILLGTEVATLPVPERARLMAADIAGLHTAGMGSMLVIPALVAAAPVLGFVAGGAATVLAGALAWGAIALTGRRQAVAEPDEDRLLVRT